ncbi:hypothetical protein Q8F55_004001 [Vanrija albida]|uniref:DUF676 domain-containing protein n=1 Tax=Vanrija albida TaxID=181172 RepID=A0ABR3Q5Q6_9TREE
MTKTKDVHLVLLIHGLWGKCLGKPEHLAAAVDELHAAWTDLTTVDMDTPTNESVNSSPSSQPLRQRDDLVVLVAEGMTSKLTYDGVDVCASRCAYELDCEIARLEADGRRVARFSVMGYSLGGLVARYLVGLLNARSPSFFDKHEPVTFSAMASPHLGIPRYNTFISTVLCWLGGRLLSRTGEQVYVVDSYSESDPRPLLEIMADPKQVFHKALSRFQDIHIYANLVNDNTVPFPSAAIQMRDPFVKWKERGLQVKYDQNDIARDWTYPEPDPLTVAKPKGKQWLWNLGTLPPTFRFRQPYSTIILVLAPILIPVIFILVILRFSLDTRRSRLRLQKLTRAMEASNHAADPSRPASPSPIGSPLGLPIDSLRAAIRKVERSIEQDFMAAAETPLPLEHDENDKDFEHFEPDVHPLMTDRQTRMVHWLNALDPNKHMAWLPDCPNSHAVIVVRDPTNMPIHERGRGVLRHWAGEVSLAAETAASTPL